jgi:hypothetical protein
MKCLAALRSESTATQDALAAANLLIGSPAVNAQVVGLTAAIGLGSDAAVAALSSSLGVVGSSPKLYLATGALATFRRKIRLTSGLDSNVGIGVRLPRMTAICGCGKDSVEGGVWRSRVGNAGIPKRKEDMGITGGISG